MMVGLGRPLTKAGGATYLSGASIVSRIHSSRQPLVVGIGGTTRPASSTERALAFALKGAQEAGARVQLFGGAFLYSLPHYAPETRDLTGAQRELIEAVRAGDRARSHLRIPAGRFRAAASSGTTFPTKSSRPSGRYGNITLNPSLPSSTSHCSISSAISTAVPTICKPE